ncbi:MAG: manganese efflux pump [Bacteroidales bacterium]|nr:manganese efflux pump [Bacteroidales bacterium]MCM1414615.1 manganese efflux pump [bacterium]MCM1423880.1 manganese efflux pump [bacterium]
MHSALSTLALFLTAVSLDSLTAGFSYGTDNVRVKVSSFLALALVPALFITAAQSLGALAGSVLPDGVPAFLSFFLLFLIGIAKLLESLIRFLAKKRPSLTGNWGCKIKQLNIVFTVYLSPEEANRSEVQILSFREALLLSMALSLDSILVGMAFRFAALSPFVLFFSAALCNLFLFLGGYLLGRLLFRLLSFDLSWFSGLCLILLAFRALA